MPRFAKLWPVLLLFFALTTTMAHSDDLIDPDLREFLLDRQHEIKGFHHEITQEYQTFIAENDRDFAQFLKEAWEEVDSKEPVRIIDRPKPARIPDYSAPPEGSEPQPPPEPVRIVIDTPPPEPAPQPAENVPPAVKVPEPTPAPPPGPVAMPATPPPAQIPPPAATPQPPPAVSPEPVVTSVPPAPSAPPATPRPDEATGTAVAFDYYGTAVKLRCDHRLSRGITPPISNDAISHYWETTAGGDFKALLTQTVRYRDQLSLNDWGYLLLLDQTAAHLLTEPTPNNRALFTWFMLTQAGYDCKVGYRNDRIAILLPATGQLYGLYYFTIGGRKYYAINLGPDHEEIGKIFTYRGSYPGAETALDFSLRSYPALKDEPQNRKLSFNFAGKEYSITVEYNRNSIPYFQFYPQNEANIYADAQAPSWIKDSLLDQLKPLIEDKPEQEAVNLLLRFTQTAFSYKTDDEQFHREKFLFPEETLYYPYSDCEDRAILFSYLVRNLLGLDVVLLNYPNHIATAVKLSGQVTGDQVIVNGVPYTICDPTYINADLGNAMPQFRGVVPKVITL